LNVLHGKDTFPPVISRGNLGYVRDTIISMRLYTLKLLLSRSRERDCTDPRDKVYGILGLTSASFSMSIRPNYALPVVDVYKNAFLTYIHHTSRLDLLQQCVTKEDSTDWPSWVPDWSKDSEYLDSFSDLASGISCADMKYISPNSLEVTGLYIAHVRSVTDAAPIGHNNSLAIMKKWYRNSSVLTGYAPDEHVLTACATVLSGHFVADRYSEHSAVPTLLQWKEFLSVVGHDGGSNRTTQAQQTIRDLALDYAVGIVSKRRLMFCDTNIFALGPSSTLPGRIKSQAQSTLKTYILARRRLFERVFRLFESYDTPAHHVWPLQGGRRMLCVWPRRCYSSTWATASSLETSARPG